MHIVDINFYRDGGSIEFTINNQGTITHVWLETPFGGEPRKLLINSKAASSGESAVRQLLKDIEQLVAGSAGHRPKPSPGKVVAQRSLL
jgi:hypothetical protein